MLYLVPVPIVILAVIVKLVADRYKVKSLSIISKIIIVVGVVFFAHFFAISRGFNIIDIVIKFFTL